MPKGVYKRTEQGKINMGLARKGNVISPEQRQKISQSLLGKKRKPFSDKHRERIGNAGKGRNVSLETRKKLSEAMKKANREGRHANWRGGITPINVVIRHSFEYRLWRETVFKRDNYTCVWCGERGGKLNADHIKPFALYPELRFAIDNGRTLCVPCHKTTDTYGNKSRGLSTNYNQKK